MLHAERIEPEFAVVQGLDFFFDLGPADMIFCCYGPKEYRQFLGTKIINSPHQTEFLRS